MASALSVARLTDRPADLPLSVLLGGNQGGHAHFYASFHSGRRQNNPISRETLRELTGVPERTQYAYEQTVYVSSQRSIPVGERYTAENAQERAWKHGRTELSQEKPKPQPPTRHLLANSWISLKLCRNDTLVTL